MFDLRNLKDPLRALAAFILIVGVNVPVLSRVHVGHTKVSGEVVARSVTMTLAKGLTLKPGLPLDARQPILLGGLDAPDQAPVLGETPTELTSIGLAPNATLIMTFRPAGNRHLLQILAFDGGSVLIDQLQGQIHVSSPPGQAVPLQVQATLGGVTPDSAKLWPRLQNWLGVDHPDDISVWAGQLTIGDVAVTALRFIEETNGQTGRSFASSIASGHVTLVDIDKTLSLEAASPLSLGGVDQVSARLVLQGDGFHVLFSGTVDAIELGPVGFPSDRMPTFLDFVLNNPVWHTILLTISWGIGVIIASIYALFKSEQESKKTSWSSGF